jgi:hypothetical protein
MKSIYKIVINATYPDILENMSAGIFPSKIDSFPVIFEIFEVKNGYLVVCFYPNIKVIFGVYSKKTIAEDMVKKYMKLVMKAKFLYTICNCSTFIYYPNTYCKNCEKNDFELWTNKEIEKKLQLTGNNINEYKNAEIWN